MNDDQVKVDWREETRRRMSRRDGQRIHVAQLYSNSYGPVAEFDQPWRLA